MGARFGTVNPSRDWQRALFIPLTILAWLAVIIVTVWLLGHVVCALLILALGVIIAIALTPLVSLFSRWFPRGIAVVLAYVLGFAAILGLLALVINTAAGQTTTLVHDLPHYQQRLEPELVRLLRPFGVTRAAIHQAEQQLVSYVRGIGISFVKGSIAIAQQTLSILLDIVLTLILSIYLTSSGPRLVAWLRQEAPSAYQRQADRLLTIGAQVIGGYIRGTLALAALIGVLVGGGMAVLGVPFAFVLGVLAFFTEFIPIVGVLISGAVCVLLALTQNWQLAIIVLAYFVVIHVIEGDVVGPRIMGHAVGIHPATAILALIAGSELFGIWGALFGSPIAGLIQAIATTTWREVRGSGSTPGRQKDMEEDKGETADGPPLSA
jgi:predicted PurR-regulated permease PerM